MHSTATDTASKEGSFSKLVHHPVKFRMFLMQKLPAAWFSGVRVKEFTYLKSVVSVPYKWFTKNPFRSTYFACLSMAAEMSTGILAMAHIYDSQKKISMLITSIEGRFHKKAIDITSFTCADGSLIKAAIDAAIASGEPTTIRAYAPGSNEDGEMVAEFWCEWSFKSKSISK